VCGVHTVCADKNGTHRPPRHQPRSGGTHLTGGGRAAAPAAQRHPPHRRQPGSGTSPRSGTSRTAAAPTSPAAATHRSPPRHTGWRHRTRVLTRVQPRQPVCQRHNPCAGHRATARVPAARATLCAGSRPVCQRHNPCAGHRATPCVPATGANLCAGLHRHPCVTAAIRVRPTPDNPCAASTPGVPATTAPSAPRYQPRTRHAAPRGRATHSSRPRHTSWRRHTRVLTRVESPRRVGRPKTLSSRPWCGRLVDGGGLARVRLG
jgi:hypothetical protein